MEMKRKINKWDLIKLLHSDGNHTTKQRQTMNQEKIFTNYATNKRLISKLYKQLI